jgi:hypothetical protein
VTLRPVSELGLAEVTDVATPASVSRRIRKPPKSRSETDDPVLPSPRPAQNPKTAGSRAAGVVTSVLSGAIGVAGAVLVGRAVLRR